MMKKISLFILCSILFISSLKSQVERKRVRVSASDSTVFNMDFLEYEGDDMYRNFIFAGIGGNDLGSILQAGYTRYEAGKFIATGEVGAFPTATEFNASGIYFLLSKKNDCRLQYRFTTTADDNDKNYIMKSNGLRNIHIGIHGQAGYRSMNLQYGPPIQLGDTIYNMRSYSSGRISAGIGLVATRNGLIYIGNNQQYTGAGSMLMAFIDGIYYPGQRISYTKQVNGQDVEATGLGLKDVTNGTAGFEICLMGQHQFHFQRSKIPRADFGARWQAGMIKMNYTGPNNTPSF